MTKQSKPDPTQARDYVTRERERQNREAVEGVRETAKRAGKIAERTSAYDAQRKQRRDAGN